jgi:hypothetical protein
VSGFGLHPWRVFLNYQMKAGKGSRSPALGSGPIDYSMEERFTVAIYIQYSTIKVYNFKLDLRCFSSTHRD